MNKNCASSVCRNKVWFESYGAAQKEAKRLNGDDTAYTEGYEVVAYHCKFCGKWHVGNLLKRRKQHYSRSKGRKRL